MSTSIEAARSLAFAAAALLDAGRESVKEASMAKLFAGQVAESVCGQAFQLLGGYGYLRDYPVERYYRAQKVCQIHEGTENTQRMIIARSEEHTSELQSLMPSSYD